MPALANVLKRAVSDLALYIDNNLKELPKALCFSFQRMGAGNMNYKEMAQQIELATGGLSVSTHVCSHHTHPNTYEQVRTEILVEFS